MLKNGMCEEIQVQERWGSESAIHGGVSIFSSSVVGRFSAPSVEVSDPGGGVELPWCGVAASHASRAAVPYGARGPRNEGHTSSGQRHRASRFLCVSKETKGFAREVYIPQTMIWW